MGFLGLKGKYGRHEKNVARKRHYRAFFGSRRNARRNLRNGWTV